MTNFKGTKGKWEITKHPETADDISFQLNNSYIDVWFSLGKKFPTAEDRKEAKANALLISKAPEMLEMLEQLEEILRELLGYDTTNIQKLIKEATEL